MPNYKFAVTSCLLLLLTLALHESVSAQANPANAESETPKFELGVQFSALGQKNDLLTGNTTNVGGGVRLTYNFNRYIAVEGELNYFPSTGVDNVVRAQGQFGVKSGFRFNRVGVFGKARPGFIYSNRELTRSCLPFLTNAGTVPSLFLPCSLLTDSAPNARFSMDVGGVLEIYSSKRVIVRFDGGDTIVKSAGIPLFIIGGPSPGAPTHNLQLGAGVVFRL